ncbi:MAG: tetratricopeptide repeat protein [Bacteroidales bacterium]|nr:tetratricopeptide repeat protein [Bacteroidales bacterium]
MRKIIALINILLISSLAFASSDDELMKKGNEAYQNGKYELAVQCYQEIVSHGNEGAVLYYNLGNAYFKAKQTPEAILWYERALRLDPSNEDIKHNIAYANLQITDKIDVLPQLFIVRWWNALSQRHTASGWATMAVIAVIVLALSVTLLLVSRRRWLNLSAMIVCLVALLIAVFAWIFAHHESKRYIDQPEAVVMQSVVNAKGSPNEEAASLFVIHEGLKVAVTDRVGNWVEIKLPNGEKGWVESASLEVI